jgi:hypothetical protein
MILYWVPYTEEYLRSGGEPFQSLAPRLDEADSAVTQSSICLFSLFLL